YDRNPFIPTMLASSFGWVAVLHLVAGWRERAGERAGASGSDGWLPGGPPLSIPDKGARIVAAPDGERIAVFRDGAQIGALSNLCAHQNGPIGRAASGTGASPGHGTAITTGWRRAARRRRIPRSSSPTACASRAAW